MMRSVLFLSRVLANRPRRSPIGLDFGADGIRGVQLLKNGDSWSLERLAQVDRLPGSEKGSLPTLQEIEECLELGEFSGRNACTALGAPDVEFVSLELPAVLCQRGGTELDRAAAIELQRLLTMDRGPVESRFWMLPAEQVPTPNAIGVAVARRLVEDLIEVHRRSGLFCNVVDTQADALCRFSRKLGIPDTGMIRGVLDLGYRQTRLTLCSDDVPVLVRSVGPGGKDWTIRIAESLGVSEKAAEILKRDQGLAATGTKGKDAESAEVGAVLRGVLRADLNELAGEIKRSYEYILGCYPNRRAGDLVLVGSGASLGGLDDFLGELLGIPVRRASDYLGTRECRVVCPRGMEARVDAFAVAIGAALDDAEI